MLTLRSTTLVLRKDLCVPLFSFLIHILILYKVSTCSLFGGSNNRRWQRWLQQRKPNYFVHVLDKQVSSCTAPFTMCYLFNIIVLCVAVLAWFSSCPTFSTQPEEEKTSPAVVKGYRCTQVPTEQNSLSSTTSDPHPDGTAQNLSLLPHCTRSTYWRS